MPSGNAGRAAWRNGGGRLWVLGDAWGCIGGMGDEVKSRRLGQVRFVYALGQTWRRSVDWRGCRERSRYITGALNLVKESRIYGKWETWSRKQVNDQTFLAIASKVLIRGRLSLFQSFGMYPWVILKSFNASYQCSHFQNTTDYPSRVMKPYILASAYG